MAENKMAEVAAMFGLKLGEKFFIKNEYNEVLPYAFKNDGLYYIRYGGDMNDHYELTKLLNGRDVIVDD